MSQAKVDKYKKQKQERKNPKKKNKVLSALKKIIPYALVAIVVILIVGYLGISVAKQTGCYTPPTEPRSWSSQEVESLRQVLIQQTDPNVQYTTVAQETTKSGKNMKKSEKTTVPSTVMVTQSKKKK